MIVIQIKRDVENDKLYEHWKKVFPVDDEWEGWFHFQC